MSFVVTIDGPAAAGKTTTARGVAARLGFHYLDTGAFYRALALKARELGGSADDPEWMAEVAHATAIDFSGDPEGPRVLLDGGRDVTAEIRAPEISELASRVAAQPRIRRLLVEWQRALRARGPLVGEGRDLGTVVFPDADVKIYLDADLDTRARRRCRELQGRGLAVRLEDVRAELERRDARDRTRAESPLRPAPDATVVDTTGMELAAQVEAVLAVVRAHPRCPAAPRTG